MSVEVPAEVILFVSPSSLNLQPNFFLPNHSAHIFKIIYKFANSTLDFKSRLTFIDFKTCNTKPSCSYR